MKIQADISRCYAQSYPHDLKIISTNDKPFLFNFFSLSRSLSCYHSYHPLLPHFQPSTIRVYHLPARAEFGHVAFPFSKIFYPRNEVNVEFGTCSIPVMTRGDYLARARMKMLSRFPFPPSIVALITANCLFTSLRSSERLSKK